MIKVNIASADKRIEIERRHRRENIEKSLQGDKNINLQVLADNIASIQERLAAIESKLQKEQ
jgi:hypothetical protein